MFILRPGGEGAKGAYMTPNSNVTNIFVNFLRESLTVLDGVPEGPVSKIKNQAPGNSSPHAKDLNKLISLKHSSVAMELIDS